MAQQKEDWSQYHRDIPWLKNKAADKHARIRQGSTKKKESNISQKSKEQIKVRPIVVVSKHSQDYSSDDTIDKECVVSRAYKLRKEQTHQDVEEHLHTTTICEL